MKYLLLFCGMFIMGGGAFSVSSADVPQSPVSLVSQAMARENWKEANRLFARAVKENEEEAEDFFWFRVDSTCPSRKEMALHLAEHYRMARNYEKAVIFYTELVKLAPANADYLSGCAEMEVMNGREKRAFDLYQRVLEVDSDHLAANIFTGNYYYFVSSRKKKMLDEEYSKLQTPTRMQFAEYHNRLENLFDTGFKKARTYLEKVVRFFPSSEIKKTLHQIERLEKQMK